VWPVGQRSAAAQRRGRFVPGSVAHPARRWPDLAKRIITEYSRPGDLVLDPLCGIGTTLVEAVHAGRDAIGVDCEHRWTTLVAANAAWARAQGATGQTVVHRGEAIRLGEVLPAVLTGRVDLVVMSPPYGKTMHGRVDHRHGPLRRFHDTYTPDIDTTNEKPVRVLGRPEAADHFDPGGRRPTNLARRNRLGLADDITVVLTSCVPFLKPGGLVVVTARPWRRSGYLIDLPGIVHAAALAAGLRPVERCHPPRRHTDQTRRPGRIPRTREDRRPRAPGRPAHHRTPGRKPSQGPPTRPVRRLPAPDPLPPAHPSSHPAHHHQRRRRRPAPHSLHGRRRPPPHRARHQPPDNTRPADHGRRAVNPFPSVARPRQGMSQIRKPP